MAEAALQRGPGLVPNRRVFDPEAALLEARREVARLADENARLASRLEHFERLALEDPLTGLPNRRAFDPFLESALTQAQAARQPVAVVMADLDHFKAINDTFSHVVGDAVLHEVGVLLRLHCRITDLAARLGGEEFAMVLPGLSGLAALEVCERLRRAVEGHAWSRIRPGLQVTVSLGCADNFGNAELDSARALLIEADAHLYTAKRMGRNRVESRSV